jgi:methionyl aminopeptidase
VKAGISTKDLDARAATYIKAEGGTPAFLGYRPNGASRPYPAVSCISVNAVVVHGLPSRYILQEGDIVSVDLGLVYEGYYADAAFTVPVGKVAPRVQELIATAEEALEAGIWAARGGNTIGDIGATIQEVVKRHKCGIVETLTGHGIGTHLHEAPWVPNTGRPHAGEKLIPGMTIAIEPMISLGKGTVNQMEDDSFVTRDGSLAAHAEHTVLITEGDAEVLTR